MYQGLGSVIMCLSPKILYLSWKCNIKIFEINIKSIYSSCLFLRFRPISFFFFFFHDFHYMKPYIEPSFRRFSSAGIVDLCTEVRNSSRRFKKEHDRHERDNLSYATIISTDNAHALIDTIITLDKNITDYIMKY